MFWEVSQSLKPLGCHVTGVKPLIVTAVTINPIWRTPKKEKSIFCFICFFVALFKILSMKELFLLPKVSSYTIFVDQYCFNWLEFEAKDSALTVVTPTQTFGKGEICDSNSHINWTSLTMKYFMICVFCIRKVLNMPFKRFDAVRLP